MKFGTSGGDFENPNPGAHLARIVHLIDLGTQEGNYQGKVTKKRKLLVGFELADKMADGRPFLVNQQYNQSMNEKSTLRIHLEGWAGKKMSEEMAGNFQVQTLLGKACVVQLVESTGEKKYINVKAIMGLMEGQKPAPQVNPSILFDLDDFSSEVYEGLTDWTKKKIADSPEYKSIAKAALGGDGHEGEAPEGHDEIPF